MADVQLVALRDDAKRLAPDTPDLSQVIEDVGLQRLAAYYLYSALVAGLIGDDEAAPAQWPPQLAEPMQRLGLTRFTPRTRRGLDAQLTAAEQEALQNPDRQLKFARLVVDLINGGAFGPLCGQADSVRLAESASGDKRDMDLELLNSGSVVARCSAEAHWELVAQYLAGVAQVQASSAGALPPHKVSRQLKETGISHAVSATITLAVAVHPLGAVAGLGTHVIRSRIESDREQADALRQLGNVLATLRTQADSELSELGPEYRERPLRCETHVRWASPDRCGSSNVMVCSRVRVCARSPWWRSTAARWPTSCAGPSAGRSRSPIREWRGSACAMPYSRLAIRLSRLSRR
jgi:hypothetical protein